jgi:hypothetical protein
VVGESNKRGARDTRIIKKRPDSCDESGRRVVGPSDTGRRWRTAREILHAVYSDTMSRGLARHREWSSADFYPSDDCATAAPGGGARDNDVDKDSDQPSTIQMHLHRASPRRVMSPYSDFVPCDRLEPRGRPRTDFSGSMRNPYPKNHKRVYTKRKNRQDIPR